jgi:PKD repeat protein
MRFSGIILALTLISILTPAFNVQIVKAESVSHQLILYTSTRDGVIRVFLNGSKQILEHVRSGYSLEILGNRIYVNQYPGYISVYTTEGVFLKNINIPSSVSYFITFVVLPDERIALLDNENDKVYFIDSLGNFITKVDILEAPDNHLQNLDGIVINNKLIISEDGNKHIIQIDLMTYKKTIFKDMSKIPEVWLGAITYSNGYYYVCGPSSIYKFSENGDVSKIAEIPDYNIVGIVVVDDYAYVSVNFGGKIYKVDLRSGISEVLTSNLNYPLDLEAQILSETLPPTLTLFEPQISGLTVTINGVATPGYEGASITGIAPHCFHWDWGDGNSEDRCFPATHTYSSAGTYTITVTAYQSDGLSTTKTLSVKVGAENKPPTAYIDSISPNPAYEGQTISFSGHGYDPDGNITECDWRADGTVLSSSCSFSTSLPPGKYTIYFRVKDDKSVWSSWVYADLVVKKAEKRKAPELTLFDPQVNGLTVTVNGVTKPGYEGASITKIKWDWGDGNSEDSWFPVIHTYSSSGTYIITITVYQSDGLSITKTMNINILPENKSLNPVYQDQSNTIIPIKIIGYLVIIIPLAIPVVAILTLRRRRKEEEEVVRKLLEE